MERAMKEAKGADKPNHVVDPIRETPRGLFADFSEGSPGGRDSGLPLFLRDKAPH